MSEYIVVVVIGVMMKMVMMMVVKVITLVMEIMVVVVTVTVTVMVTVGERRSGIPQKGCSRACHTVPLRDPRGSLMDSEWRGADGGWVEPNFSKVALKLALSYVGIQVLPFAFCCFFGFFYTKC